MALLSAHAGKKHRADPRESYLSMMTVIVTVIIALRRPWCWVRCSGRLTRQLSVYPKKK
jgi:hypothetical protein